MRFKLSGGVKDAAKISIGTIIGQLASIISLPILTRIYGAEIIGIWATIFAISSIINTFSDFGLIQSIMLESKETVAKLYQTVITVIFILSAAAVVFVWIYCVFIMRYETEQALTIILFSIVYAVTYQLVQVEYTLLNRDGNYPILMKNPIVNQLTASLTALVLGLIGFKQYGYFIGITAGQILTLIHMKRHIPYKFRFCGLSQIIQTIKEHKHFAKYQMPVNLTLQARDQVPNLLINSFFGAEILGYYAISQKLLNIPITFIGQALGRVFYQRCANMRREGQDIAQFFYRNLKRAIIVAAIPMILIGAYGDAAIVMFFGREYEIAGIIVRIIVFRSFFTFVSAATRSIDIILDKQHYAMASSLTQTILMSASVIIAAQFFDSIVMCTAFMTISFILVQITYFCAMFRVMKMPMINYLKNIIPALFAIAVVSIVARYAFILLTNITGWAFFEYLAQFLVNV